MKKRINEKSRPSFIRCSYSWMALKRSAGNGFLERIERIFPKSLMRLLAVGRATSNEETNKRILTRFIRLFVVLIRGWPLNEALATDFWSGLSGLGAAIHECGSE